MRLHDLHPRTGSFDLAYPSSTVRMFMSLGIVRAWELQGFLIAVGVEAKRVAKSCF